MELQTLKGEARVDHLLLAKRLGNQHQNVIALIDQYVKDFEEFGRVAFETRTIDTAGGPQKQRVALLNEDQAYLLLTYSRNTPTVMALKIYLVKAFARFRRHQQTEADYLPFYHELHDQVKVMHEVAQLKGSTTPERIFHININKIINAAFGLESGQRQGLPGHLRAKVTAVNVFANEAIQKAIEAGLDHKTAFQLAKRAVHALAGENVIRLTA
ncbi:Rha family transcriptional regulator [Methylomonas sp. 2BW1-5-20]|uniref:Rha family transcriptional regulator n=1 Tax=Methylomonas sp. 2BW1-5-20 TaxID=3376686 RepID=UPI004051A1E4